MRTSFHEVTWSELILQQWWGPPRWDTCSLVPLKKIASLPCSPKSKSWFPMFPVLQNCLCSPFLDLCSPEINAIVPLLPETPGRASMIGVVYATNVFGYIEILMYHSTGSRTKKVAKVSQTWSAVPCSWYHRSWSGGLVSLVCQPMYHKNPKISDARNVAVITLKVEQGDFP